MNSNGLAVVGESLRIGGIGTVATAFMLRGKAPSMKPALLWPLNQYRTVFTIEEFHFSCMEAVAGQWVGFNLRATSSVEGEKQFIVFPKDGESKLPDASSLPTFTDCFTVEATLLNPETDLASKPFKAVKLMKRLDVTSAIVLNVEKLSAEGERFKITLKCASRIAVAEDSRIPELSKLMILSACGSDSILASATVVSVVEQQISTISMGVPLEIDGPKIRASGFPSIDLSWVLLRNEVLDGSLKPYQRHILQLRRPWALDNATFAACEDFVKRGGTLLIVHTPDPAALGAPDLFCDRFGIEWTTRGTMRQRTSTRKTSSALISCSFCRFEGSLASKMAY